MTKAKSWAPSDELILAVQDLPFRVGQMEKIIGVLPLEHRKEFALWSAMLIARRAESGEYS